eukprot:CAMPEP_0197664534 /NCGR_PEP_ID=MMETSP1338-20131121/58696_1 /TAXON_ID=43686 ORGANISM="Pelagodinium beii, Strain RCC1491" /NCGR_SAMPLE_ID=MMETSP1338 /ASSEMBLY_ACC=CAM_ASM_000754 /LENGTH=268 /DNA_ID=CAMNT_0043243197 /DNA_START=208 /DNA_END=1016 /DNA_ORIENTATION=-
MQDSYVTVGGRSFKCGEVAGNCLTTGPQCEVPSEPAILSSVAPNLLVKFDLEGNVDNSGAKAAISATLKDGGSYVAAKKGQGLHLDGTSFVELSLAHNNGNYPKRDFTVSAWTKLSKWPEWCDYFADIGTASSGAGICSGIQFSMTQNYWQVGFTQSGWGTPWGQGKMATIYHTKDIPALGTWFHWAMVRSNGKLLLYKDGQMIASVDSDFAVNKDNDYQGCYADSSVSIGKFIRQNYDSKCKKDFVLDDWRLYDVALTTEQVQALAS